MYVVITRLQKMKFEFVSTHHCCYLFVCILFAVHLENGDAKIIADEGLQIKTFSKYSWPLNSKCYLARYAYFTGYQVFNFNKWYSHLLPSVWQCNWHYLFQRRRLVATEIRTVRSTCWHHRCSSRCSFYMNDCTIDYSSPYCFQKHDLLFF